MLAAELGAGAGRIRTTHTGSLPRPRDLAEMLARRDRGEAVAGFEERVTAAVAEIVERQRAAGIDVVGDGEAGKINYTTYVTERLEGFGGASDEGRSMPRDWVEFPEFFSGIAARVAIARPACVAPVRHRSLDPLRKDIANLRAALGESAAQDAFMTAASPGVIEGYLQNKHYATHEDYIWAVADAMKPEYDAIHAAGFLLQLDSPDLTSRDTPAELASHIAAINHATRDIPPERMRLHLCWGNFEGPHNQDVPLAEIIDLVLTARPAGLSFEAANPRHAHEWRVFEELELPDGKILIPGVIDSTTNYIEHPRLVADRIARYAGLVGRDRVIAGTDCGFATIATYLMVDPAIAWAKLGALSEGARLASRELSRSTATGPTPR
jgi:5-methyltetrahydropteroyltriglutamate--homocysteine methyltransferase